MFVNDSSGVFGLMAASRVPERISGMVVADTVPIPMTGAAAPVRALLQHVICSRPMRWLKSPFQCLAWSVTVTPFLHPLSREERRAMVAQYDTPVKRDRVLDVFAHMAADKDFLQAAARAAARELHTKPALILFGQFDPMRLVGGVSRYAAIFPRNFVRIIPFEDHFPILGSGEKVAAAIAEFTSRLGDRIEAT